MKGIAPTSSHIHISHQLIMHMHSAFYKLDGSTQHISQKKPLEKFLKIILKRTLCILIMPLQKHEAMKITFLQPMKDQKYTKKNIIASTFVNKISSTSEGPKYAKKKNATML
jgi:hypothetical protein